MKNQIQEPATEKQLAFILKLDPTAETADLGKFDASRLIGRLLKAKKAEEGKKPGKAKPAKAEPRNAYGVKVGDVFVASWGYDQTNVDFFQVVKICGEKFVRVVQVYPDIETSDYGPMSQNIKAKIGGMCDRLKDSIFIHDQENGDLHKVQEDGWIKISSVAWAHPYRGEKLYESWYA